MSDHSLALVGMPGGGKSTVGRHLARRLSRDFVDSDLVIERRVGCSIRTFFEQEGEERFRELEAAVLTELLHAPDAVVATGGGIVLREANRELLRRRSVCIYLRSTPEELFRRVRHDAKRPLLQVADPLAKLRELFVKRDPLYRETARFVIETGRPSVPALVNMILMQLELAGVAAALISDGNEQRVRPYTGRMNHSDSQRIRIDLGERSYDILVGDDLLGQPDSFAGLGGGVHTALIVTNTTVAPMYAQRLAMTLQRRFARVDVIELPDGEAHKDWPTLNLIFDALLGGAFDRKTTLFALGGGVVGDMTGFAAACYMRGVPYVQVPTTLLAQVDSSVGGKTAINHPLGKNMIGVFNQPKLVVADLDTLATLPERELIAGLAEVIKYGPIADAAFLDWIDANLDALKARDKPALAYAVRRSCEIKAWVVAQDEREAGLREILNFGHTFGHAIETGLGYGAWLHGEAVGCGMVMGVELSRRLGLIDTAYADRVRRIVERAGLPVLGPRLGTPRYLELMRLDKKTRAGSIRFVVIEAPGRAGVRAVDDALVAEVLDAHTR